MSSTFSLIYNLECVAEKPAKYVRTSRWFRNNLDICFYSFFVDRAHHSNFATINGATISIGSRPYLFAGSFDALENDVNYAIYTVICGFYEFEHGGIADKETAKSYLQETTPFILDPQPGVPNKSWPLMLKHHHIGFDRLGDEGIRFRIIDNYPHPANNPDPVLFKKAADISDMRNQVAKFEQERHQLRYSLPHDAAIYPAHVFERIAH